MKSKQTRTQEAIANLKRKGLSLTQIAVELDVREQTVYQWERGGRIPKMPSIEKLERMAKGD